MERSNYHANCPRCQSAKFVHTAPGLQWIVCWPCRIRVICDTTNGEVTTQHLTTAEVQRRG